VSVAVVAALVSSAATAGLTWAIADRNDGERAAVAAADEPNADKVAQDEPAVAAKASGESDWRAVADAVRPSVVAIAVISSSGSGEGSGVIVDDAGHVLTNNHVVGGAERIKVTLADGRVYDATLVGTDPTTDLAVVAITDAPDDLKPAAIGDSDAVEVGDAVMAVGNPLGLDSTATTGIVSALDRPVSTGSVNSTDVVVTNAIQVDAAVNPGNSGGPLFNASGQVIGITSSIATLSQTGGSSGSIGLGFAIPANLAERVVNELVSGGAVEHAFLGVYLSDGTATVGKTTRLGAVVEKISDGTPAAEADLKAGDVVVAIDGEPVSGALSLTAYVREHGVGDTVKLSVVRDGETREVSVTLTARDESSGSGDSQQEGGLPSRPTPGG
jgi:putative serine protease PepD